MVIAKVKKSPLKKREAKGTYILMVHELRKYASVINIKYSLIRITKSAVLYAIHRILIHNQKSQINHSLLPSNTQKDIKRVHTGNTKGRK